MHTPLILYSNTAPFGSYLKDCFPSPKTQKKSKKIIFHDFELFFVKTTFADWGVPLVSFTNPLAGSFKKQVGCRNWLGAPSSHKDRLLSVQSPQLFVPPKMSLVLLPWYHGSNGIGRFGRSIRITSFTRIQQMRQIKNHHMHLPSIWQKFISQVHWNWHSQPFFLALWFFWAFWSFWVKKLATLPCWFKKWRCGWVKLLNSLGLNVSPHHFRILV